MLGMRSTNSDGLGALSLISLSTVTESFNHMLKSINTCDEAFEMIFLSSGLPGFGRGMESDVSVRVLCRPSPNSSTLTQRHLIKQSESSLGKTADPRALIEDPDRALITGIIEITSPRCLKLCNLRHLALSG